MLCPDCFQNKAESSICPLCGFDESAPVSPLALPFRTLLHNTFLTGRLLGKPGGFGLTYLAWDTVLDVHVAVKEYLPRETAGRGRDAVSVVSHSSEDAETFAMGLGKFLEEARALARFDHPNVVRVRSFFEANGTAYMVMNYYRGETLDEVVVRTGKLEEKQAIDTILPVLSGMEEVHRQGFLHRDVKPRNIYLTRDGVPILLDFGGARQAVGESSHSMSLLFTPGYSPYEQHQSGGDVGPWSDVYAIGATLYFLLTGQDPVGAVDRGMSDSLQSPRDKANTSEVVSQAVMTAMAVRIEDRYQDVASLRAALLTHAGQASWDVFLCKKSEDAHYAKQVHDFLSSHGVSCFLSELAIPEVSNAEYLRVINRAVETCMHMVVVASKPKHLTASWVEAEWSMFLNEKRSGRKPGNLVTVLAGGMSPSGLPIGLRDHHAVELDPPGLEQLRLMMGATGAYNGLADRTPQDPSPVSDSFPSQTLDEAALADGQDAWAKASPGQGPSEPGKSKGARSWLILAGVALLAAVVAGAIFLMTRDGGNGLVREGEVTDTQDKAAPDVESEFGPMGPRSGDTWTEPLTRMEFVWVEGGCYEMGCGEWTGNCQDDEFPVHMVCVNGFWLGKYEVTQGQWETVMAENHSFFARGDTYPVEQVSWENAQSFIETLEDKADSAMDFRLPTEAEWEYACRSGGQEEMYSGGDEVDPYTWYWDNSEEHTHPVGTREPNGLGIHDMSGNVWEWVQDWYNEDAYSFHYRDNPVFSDGTFRVFRGSSWLDNTQFVRCGHRGWNDPDDGDYNVGLRLLREPTQAELAGEDKAPEDDSSQLHLFE
ncbi:MAG: TIR domain-containing protein [Desulfovibrio sp.]|nr:MAG: TIR domain-containing protein [Desulfovibrio sp.]